VNVAGPATATRPLRPLRPSRPVRRRGPRLFPAGGSRQARWDGREEGPERANGTKSWRGRARWTARQRRDALAAYLLISPAFLLFLCFILGPLIGAVVLSLFNYDLLSPPIFVGLGNYRYLLHDGVAWGSLFVTTEFTVASVVLHVVVGLGLAMLVNRRMSTALRYGLRTAILFPVLISWAVVSLIAEYTLDPNFGFITYYLGRLGLHNLDVFEDPHTALAAIVGVDLWHTVGFSFIVLLAGLQMIPPYLYEAARVDGAGTFRVFRSMTLPMLSPSLFFVIVISFIGAFQIFDPVHIITQGGPGNDTESIVQYIYQTGFTNLQVGYAAALGLLVLVVLLLATLAQFGLARFWVHDELGD
jgi:multiple sugar transport system permease protein